MIKDIENRKVIWIALSELFLDTDVTLNYDYIINECASSKYSIIEMREILLNEVAPSLAFNMYDIAGEWAGFDEEWLVNRIVDRIKKNKSLVNKLLAFLSAGPINRYALKHWNILSVRISDKRNENNDGPLN